MRGPQGRPALADEHLVHTLRRVHADIAALEPADHDDGDHEIDVAMDSPCSSRTGPSGVDSCGIAELCFDRPDPGDDPG
ncbi:MAG: hypothetical protein ACRBN8_45865 [Nannocystales bacterium]